MSKRTDTTPSPQALAQQLDAEKRVTKSLRAQNRALWARLMQHETPADDKVRRRLRDERGLLENLAEAFHLADIAGNPLQTGALHDGPPTRSLRDNERPMPGSGTHLARARARDLRREVSEALGKFWWSSENDWKRKPHPRADIPKVRCGRRDCSAYDINVDAWFTVRGGKTIPREKCATCGEPYSRETDE